MTSCIELVSALDVTEVLINYISVLFPYLLLLKCHFSKPLNLESYSFMLVASVVNLHQHTH